MLIYLVYSVRMGRHGDIYVCDIKLRTMHMHVACYIMLDIIYMWIILGCMLNVFVLFYPILVRHLPHFHAAWHKIMRKSYLCLSSARQLLLKCIFCLETAQSDILVSIIRMQIF